MFIGGRKAKMNKLKKIQHILKNKSFWAIILIMLMGGILRSWNFGDWMHYQLDQARDYRIIHAAIEYGPGELPLQGPRAAGSFLRLGPLFYYLEYLSALIFGDNPTGSIIIILILNILAIPIFYLFIKKFFSQTLSIGMTAIFASSIFLITYSRFGWNPTLLVFFMLSLVYSLLESTDIESKKREWWLIIASTMLAFVMNMHFIAFAAAPVIVIIYFLWTRPKFKLKYWIIAIMVFIFLNIPLIINDLKTGGDNTKEFIETVLNRSEDKDGNHNILEKLVHNTGFHAQYNWLILTGDQKASLPDIKGRDIKCDQTCRDGIAQGILSILLISFAIISWFINYLSEKDKPKKDFLKLIAIWWTVIFAVYTLLAYDMAPRFFLFNAPLTLIMFALVLRTFIKRNGSFGKKISISLIIICIISNLIFTGMYFNELSRAASDKDFELNHSDNILKEKTRVTLSQMESIVNWMESKHKENTYPIFINAQPEYKRAFWERVDIRDIDRDSIPGDLNPLYRQGNYFLIIRTQSDQNDYLQKYKEKMNIIETKNFGTLTAYFLKPKAEFITKEKKVFKEESRDPKFATGVQVRYLWRQILEK